ncbi:MAG: aspartate aminotransferase family protein [Haloarculaceae archaeon]
MSSDLDRQTTRRTDGSAAVPHFGPDREPLEIVDGDGVWVTDADGNEHLDFVSQLYCVNCGHGNEHIIGKMTEQLGRVQYVSSAKHSEPRTRLAERLAEVAPGELSDVYFAVSGSEANESAVQFARAASGASKVLTRYRSYHGVTYGAGSLTGDPEPRNAVERGAATTSTARFLPPIPEAFDADGPEELAEEAADHLEFVIRNEGPESIAALLTEPIAGTCGAYTGPADYFERVRALCDEYDIALIFDEVITGFGRCGEWFGAQTEGVEPDMITFAKGVTSAYAPLAGVLMDAEMREHLDDDLDVGQTYGGHPVACAAGLGALDEYEDGLIENVRELEPVMADALEGMAARHDVISEIRGRGFHWAVEFADPETGEPFHDPRVDEGHNPVEDVLYHARDERLIAGPGRPPFQAILSPPLCTTADDIEEAITRMEAAIEATSFE